MDRVIEEKPWVNKRILLVFVGVLLLGILVYFYPKEAFQSVSLEALRFQKVTQGKYFDAVVTLGTVESSHIVYVDAATSGRIEAIHVKEGDFVKKGDVIATISNPQVELDVASKQATIVNQINTLLNTEITTLTALEDRRSALERNQAKLKKLKQKQSWTETLFRQGHESRSTLESLAIDIKAENSILSNNQKLLSIFERMAQEQLYELQATVKVLRSKLELTHELLSNLQVLASFDGQITDINITVGQYTELGNRIAKIEDPKKLEVVTFIDQSFLTKLNTTSKVSFDLGTVQIPLNIKHYSPKVESDGTIKVTLSINDKSTEPDIADNQVTEDGSSNNQSAKEIFESHKTIKMNLVSGLQKSVRFEFSSNEALVINYDDFAVSNQGEYVYVVNSDRKQAKRTSVQFGRINGRQIEILSGLKVGESIITSSYTNFINTPKLKFN